MKHIKLETLATLGKDFITKSSASIEWNKEDNTKSNLFSVLKNLSK